MTELAATRQATFQDPESDEYEAYGFENKRDENLLAFQDATETLGKLQFH